MDWVVGIVVPVVDALWHLQRVNSATVHAVLHNHGRVRSLFLHDPLSRRVQSNVGPIPPVVGD